MVELPQKVPVLNDRRIHTLLKDTLIVFFACLDRVITDVLANIRINDVIEQVIVLGGVEIVILRELIQQVLFVVIHGLVIKRHIRL